jgi:Fe-S-cluster containining protein
VSSPTPIRTRPGARFECRGDGVCCSDVHALSPLRKHDRRTLRGVAPDLVGFDERIGAHVILPREGRCPLWSGEGCRLHAEHGARAKPSACRTFPFGAVRTPTGVRITTCHRCPCRTLGARPPLDVRTALDALTDRGGRRRSERAVGALIPVTATRSCRFEAYEAWEAPLLEQLQSGRLALDVLGAAPALPALTAGTWREVATFLRRAEGTGARFDRALQWFGHGLALLLGQPDAAPPRPWQGDFDRAEARAPTVGSAAAVLGDYLADALWSLGWLRLAPLDVAVTELAVRYLVLEAITEELARYARMDRAAAEAVLVVEMATESNTWGECVRVMLALPSAAAQLVSTDGS